MAKMKDGIFGGISGKIGEIVSVRSPWGLIIRSKPTPNNPQSPLQQANRSGFAQINNLLTKILPFIKQGYKNVKVGYPLDRAKSVNLTVARSGEQGNEYINYPFLKVAEGMLLSAKDAICSFAANGDLVFNWTDNSGEGNARATDRAMLLVICPELQHSEYTLKGATRDSGQDSLVIPPALLDKELHAYIAFVSKNEKLISDSAYVEIS
ncbi:MAG: DUF6266 family protein [Balneolales bacterium]